MSSPDQNNVADRSSGSSIWQHARVRRFLIYAAVLLVVFLLGLVPMWVSAREHARERNAAQTALRISTLQNSLASAAIDARRGEYEPARKAASDFFTDLRAETDRGHDSAFSEAQHESLRSIFDSRDDTITLLARNDPASADRLTDLYVKYRKAVSGAQAP